MCKLILLPKFNSISSSNKSTSCSTGKTAGSIVTESAGSTTSGCKPCSSSELTGVALGLR